MSRTLKVSALAVFLFALAGCASQSDNNASLSATPTASGKATLTPTAGPVCLANQLVILRGQEGGAMGHIGIDSSAFKNVSKSTCTLKGYPKLQMLDASGHHIATYIKNGASYTVQSQPVNVVVLSPGGEAMFDLGYANSTGYGNASCPASAQVEITPPGTAKPLTVSWHLQPYGGATIAKLRCGEITVSPVYQPIRA